MQDHNELPMMASGWAPQVRVFGETKFVGNALRFATEAEAKAQVEDLARRWTLVDETRVIETTDPVNCRWVRLESRLEMLPDTAEVSA